MTALTPLQDDPFELFISATDIRYVYHGSIDLLYLTAISYCYYSETHKVLGSTYGMCVLQDFEAVTPSLLARTIETVEGGGIIVILLRTVASLKQLYTLSMVASAMAILCSRLLFRMSTLAMSLKHIKMSFHDSTNVFSCH